jgi:chemotaxis protein histidine kinase CheA
LGLAIVRHVVERHGGSVQVESELGQGSTFRLRFPQTEEATTEEATTEEATSEEATSEGGRAGA